MDGVYVGLLLSLLLDLLLLQHIRNSSKLKKK